MRKSVIVFVSMAVAAVTVLSCSKEKDFKDKTPDAAGITINVLSGEADTRTMAVDGDVPTIQWVNTDQVAVFEVVDGEVAGAAYSEAAVIDAEGRASFSTTLNWDDPEGLAYKYSAVYPAKSVTSYEENYYIILPAEQALVGNNFSEDSDILFSTPLDHGTTRATDGEDVMFSFRRLGTVIRLRLKGIGVGEKIGQVTLTAPTYVAGAIVYDPVTSTVDSKSAFEAYASDTIVLSVEDVVATGDDVVWFRVMAERDWAAGDEFSIKVITDKSVYQKEVTLPSAIKFPDGGLTKFGVSLVGCKPEPVNVPCLWDFEDGTDDWTFLDNDGDGYNWYAINGFSSYAYSGTSFLASESYSNGYALTPDNWAFTPPVQLTEDNYLSFWVRAVDPSYQAEHYAVYITKESPLGTMTTLLPETEFPQGDYAETSSDGYYHRHIIKIPEEFEDDVVYIGIRHFNCTDQYMLLIDDVEITEGEPSIYVPEPVTVPCLWDFEENAKDWTLIDADQDGYNWFRQGSEGSGINANSGYCVLSSQSYTNNSGALTPDNWAFTPPVILTSDNYLSFWVVGQDPSWAEEHFAVYITETAPSVDNLEACIELLAEQESSGTYQSYAVQIPSSFDGKTVYIGFRHFNCTDMFVLNLDDVSITEGAPATSKAPALASVKKAEAAPKMQVRLSQKGAPQRQIIPFKN